ncbi:MAG: xanthine dehydrogenase family protein molybdopterin-binding subunit [Hyphomicrobiaceae bacterium]
MQDRKTASGAEVPAASDRWTGRPIERFEDASLLTGQQRYIDDIGVPPGTLHAAFVRSPHAHANIEYLDVRAALASPGIHAVITGRDIKRYTRPFTVGVKAPMEHWSLAIDRVRYQGEPVAIVLGETPYIAEDGAALVTTSYVPLPAVVDTLEAMNPDTILLHDALESNVIADRQFVYGDPTAAFDTAPHTIQVDVCYPRNSVTPIECNGVIASYHAGDSSYEVTSNFQGPFALHPVMAMALQVPGNRLRLISPPASGGSFGTKHSVFTYIVALCVAARLSQRPVKWIEDRLEHLMAATSATSRMTTLKAAVDINGRIAALDWDQIDDCGAYLRAPEPATIYRMHGNMTGAYNIRHLAVRNRNVLTNKTPSGLVRGFGGPQVYFALERLMHRIALALHIDPIEVIKTNLISSQDFPYRTASGGSYDSGDYTGVVQKALDSGFLACLEEHRSVARAAGRCYGIGLAAIVEPSISNMGYITTVLSADERERAGPKGGAVATATVSVDALGGVSAHIASVPQGQGHVTVIAQVIADSFAISPDEVLVNTELDTGRDAWSVASGNYSSRFSGAVAGAAHMAAQRLRRRISEIAAAHFGCEADDIIFANGRIGSRTGNTSIPFRRLAATSHWAQATLPQGMHPVIRETVFWSPDVLAPPNSDDEINSSAAHGFVFDICGVEVDRETGRVTVKKYLTVHDAGLLLNPALANGQIRGGFSNAMGAALFEHFKYGPDGSFLSGTFADYTVPTAAEIPDIEIVHFETASPVTPLGAKGIGEGNCMSTPVCIANAVADALGIESIELPLTPSRLQSMLADKEPPPPPSHPMANDDLPPELQKYTVVGNGTTIVPMPPHRVWSHLLDVESLRSIVPGCQSLENFGNHEYRGRMALGVGIVKGAFDVSVRLKNLNPKSSLTLLGEAAGPLGVSKGEAIVRLAADTNGARVDYHYGFDLSGKVASIGGRMIKGAACLLIAEFFNRLASHEGPSAASRGTPKSRWQSLLLLLRTRIREFFSGGNK